MEVQKYLSRYHYMAVRLEKLQDLYDEYIERIRWYISNEVERLKKDNEWLTAKVGGRRLRNGPNN